MEQRGAEERTKGKRKEDKKREEKKKQRERRGAPKQAKGTIHKLGRHPPKGHNRHAREHRPKRGDPPEEPPSEETNIDTSADAPSPRRDGGVARGGLPSTPRPPTAGVAGRRPAPPRTRINSSPCHPSTACLPPPSVLFVVIVVAVVVQHRHERVNEKVPKRPRLDA